MLKLSDSNIIITGSGVYATAESTDPFVDFGISPYDQILLFSDEKDLYISVEYVEGNQVEIYGYINKHIYPYVFLAKYKKKIEEELINVVKEFV